MAAQFIKMTLAHFMDRFIPFGTGKGREPRWRVVFSAQDAQAQTLCSSFSREIQTKKVCPGHTIISSRTPTVSKCVDGEIIDGGLYATHDAPSEINHEVNPSQRVSVTWMGADIRDPFDDTTSNFEDSSEGSQVARDHLVANTLQLFLRQQRCFHFSVLILGSHARLIRWDRAGAVVTEKFKYVDQPNTLCRFLWRFCHLSDEQQGLDPSAVRVLPGFEDYALMDWAARNLSDECTDVRLWDVLKDPRPMTDAERLDWARSCFEESLEDGWPRWKLSVCGEATMSDEHPVTHTYLVGKPHFNHEDLFGRGTRGYIALDCEEKEFVFLKDTWRLDVQFSGGRKEGDTMEVLKKASVRNIPTVRCHGDVQDQHTATFENWVAPPSADGTPLDMSRMHLFHYRLVECEVGRLVGFFENSHDLVKIILDCLHAHQDAVNKAEIMHRDISIGNILIVYRKGADGKVLPYGVLNDWEFSQSTSDAPACSQECKVKQRVGTWQFQSVHSQMNAYKPITVQDELESFFYVLLYCAVRWLPSNCRDVSAFNYDFFTVCHGENFIGTAKIKSMSAGYLRPPTHGRRPTLCIGPVDGEPHILNGIIYEIFRWLDARYRRVFSRLCYTSDGKAIIIDEDAVVGEAELGSQMAKVLPVATPVASHDAMCNLLEKMERHADWPANDRVADRELFPNPVPPRSPLVRPVVNAIRTQPMRRAKSSPPRSTEDTAGTEEANAVAAPSRVGAKRRTDDDPEPGPSKRAKLIDASRARGSTHLKRVSTKRRPVNADTNCRPTKRVRHDLPSNPVVPTRRLRYHSVLPPPCVSSGAFSYETTRRSGEMILRQRPRQTRRFAIGAH